MSDTNQTKGKLNLTKDQVEKFMLLIIKNRYLPITIEEIDRASVIHKIEDCPTGEELIKACSNLDTHPCLRIAYIALGFSEPEIERAEGLIQNLYKTSLKRSYEVDEDMKKTLIDFFGSLVRAEEFVK